MPAYVFLVTCLWALTIALGAGVTTGAIFEGELWLARGLYIASAVVLLAGFIGWLIVDMRRPFAATGRRVLFGGITFLYVIIFFPGLLYWTNLRQAALRKDVTLMFVYPNDPSLLLKNPSDVAVRDIKYWVTVWDLDKLENTNRNPLPIPVEMFDYIRPHESGGPQGIFLYPAVKPLLKDGDRLFGLAGVTCPDCIVTRQFWLYVIWGHGGWYSPMPPNTGINLEATWKQLPQIAKDPDKFFSWLPANQRIQIKSWP